jgi:signal transduction histidine kinase
MCSAKVPPSDSTAPAQAGQPGAVTAAQYSAVAELQERERLRIGFDLHDGPAQSLSAALLQVSMLQGAEGDALQAGLEDLRTTLKAALAEMYALVDDLGCRTPAHGGLVTKVEAHVETFRDRHGLDCGFEVRGLEVPVTSSLQIAISRIVQEALSNVGQHSGATRADVRLDFFDHTVECEVIDDGRGFLPAEVDLRHDGRERYGLTGMRQRAQLINGECIVVSEPGRGTKVTARIPIWRG